MKIVQAVENDLIDVLFLLKECVISFNEKGIKHWNNAYPGSRIIIKAIEDGSLYLYKELGIVKGMVILSEEEPEEYKQIDWQANNSKVLYLKFLAVNPTFEKEDVESNLITFSEQYAREHTYSAIRTEIYSGIKSSEQICNNLGFNKTGQFHSTFQQAPFITYEKSL